MDALQVGGTYCNDTGARGRLDGRPIPIAAGKVDVIDAIVSRVSHAKIAQVKISIRILLPPVGKQFQVLSPVKIRVTKETHSTAGTVACGVKETQVVGK